MTGATSTNTLGFLLWTGAVTIASWIATVASQWRQLRKEGTTQRPLWSAARASVLPAFFETIAIFLLVLCVWGYFTARTVVYEHETENGTVSQLRSENKILKDELNDAKDDAEQRCEAAKEHQIGILKRRLNTACFRPDRHLTQEDHTVIFAALEKIAEEQKSKRIVPKIRLLCACQDTEVSNFTNDEIWPLFRNAGWTVAVDTPSEKLTKEQIQKKYESQRAWIYQFGFADGITVFDKDLQGYGFLVSMPFYERGYGGTWDQRHTQLPDVDELTIWIGFKATK